MSLFSSQQHIHLSVIERTRSRSLPASPSCSPRVQPKRLGGSFSKSIIDLRDSIDSEQTVEDGMCKYEHKFEVLKTEEDQNVSSCESAQTVGESGVLPDCITITGPPKEELDQCTLVDESSTLTPQEVMGVDTVLQRPDKLKGIYSPRKGQSNVASISLAFPSSGSLPSASWADVHEKKKPEEWGNFSFSPVFGATQPDSVTIEKRYCISFNYQLTCFLDFWKTIYT